MPLMHDIKFRKESDTRKKLKKGKKKKREERIAMDTQKPDYCKL